MAHQKLDQYPGATVIGTDLSAIQPEFVPPNCHFEIDDVTLDWTYPEDYFDFVHIRELFGCIPDWDFFFQQAYEHIRPGGWIEIVEHSVEPIADDDSMGPDHFFHTWGKTVVEMGQIFGKSFTIWSESRERMEKAGFVDIVVVPYKWPMNGWPEDKKQKNIGRWNQLRLHEGIEGFMIRLLTQVGGVGVCPESCLSSRVNKASGTIYVRSYISRKCGRSSRTTRRTRTCPGMSFHMLRPSRRLTSVQNRCIRPEAAALTNG